MTVANPYIWNWQQALNQLWNEPHSTELRLEKHAVQHPRDAGLRVGMGLPLGQIADYRLRLADNRGLHVRDFGSYYLAHIDQTDPACDPLLHLLQDAPKTAVSTFAAVGALLGLALGQNEKAAGVGAALGLLAGSLAVAGRGTR